ncbi:MAG: LapA family protein [Burkholderiaceae bacterium]|nr:MAG: LapA family protein [Burkholderiaceae bacterium]TAM05252.1 MAG: LapA family protein [Pusillimonas sp.]
MRYLVWVLRLLVFVLVLLFALKNTDPVNVHFYADRTIAGVPLIVVMLAAFVLGIVLTLLAVFPANWRRRREVRKLRRDLQRLQELALKSGAPEPLAAREAIAPLAPL